MITLENIRERLIAEIRMSGKKVTEIAKMLGIKYQSVSAYLTGKAMPALDTFANLCAVLDLDAEEILCLKDATGKPEDGADPS